MYRKETLKKGDTFRRVFLPAGVQTAVVGSHKHGLIVPCKGVVS